MKRSDKIFWKQYIANLQVDLSYAAYTKVERAWEDIDYTPMLNKFYYIMEGEGFLRIRGQTFYPKPQELYLLPANSIQSYGTINDNTFGKYWCHFTAKIGEIHLFDVLETPSFIRIDQPERWKDRFERLVDYSFSDKLTSRLQTNSILLELIAAYIEQCDKVKFNLKAAPAFEKMNVVLQHIETHLKDNLTVEALAQIAHFHPNYFIQIFKNFTGNSPIQYINRVRLDKAKHLLTMTELNVSAIADAVGLELSYFSRMFREHNGLSPSAYRESVPKSERVKFPALKKKSLSHLD
jgi:AraC family transcriptional regulator of arabinose operon